MSLYVRGSVNRYAIIDHIKTEELEGWKILDEKINIISELALSCGVYVERESIKEYKSALVIHNKHNQFGECLYSSEAFECNLNINDDNSFEEKSNNFIEKLNKDERLEEFKNLEYSIVAKRYFVTS